MGQDPRLPARGGPDHLADDALREAVGLDLVRERERRHPRRVAVPRARRRGAPAPRGRSGWRRRPRRRRTRTAGAASGRAGGRSRGTAARSPTMTASDEEQPPGALHARPWLPSAISSRRRLGGDDLHRAVARVPMASAPSLRVGRLGHLPRLDHEPVLALVHHLAVLVHELEREEEDARARDPSSCACPGAGTGRGPCRPGTPASGSPRSSRARRSPRTDPRPRAASGPR